MQQFAREQQPITQIGEIGMDAEFPGIAEGLDGLRLLGQVRVVAVLDIALADEGLEVGAVFDAVGRVDIDGLHPPGHPLLVQQAVHDEQAVARDQAVGPAALVAVEVDGVAQRQILEGGVEEPGLHRPRGAAAAALPLHRLAHGGEDAQGVDPLVHVQAHGVDLEAGALGLAGPVEIGRLAAPEFFERRAHPLRLAARQGLVDQGLERGAPRVEGQRRVQVRVIGPAGASALGVGGGGDHADLGIVAAPVRVSVGEDLHRLTGRRPGGGRAGRRPRLAPGDRGGRGRLGFEAEVVAVGHGSLLAGVRAVLRRHSRADARGPGPEVRPSGPENSRA